MKRFTLNAGTYDFSYYLLVGESDQCMDNVRKFAKRLFGDAYFDPQLERRSACVMFVDGFFPIMWIRKNPETPKEFGTMAHECSHLATYIFWHIGANIDHENDEPYAHLIGKIVRDVMSKLKK
jgi:hypothetical protein